MRIHLIAIGGAVMHNLAIALKLKGYEVSGSDDEIFEPSRSRLASYKLLPMKEGWDPDLITPGIDVIILGMHAAKDNPELVKAGKLGLKIMSFPEYIYEQTKNKKRIVVAGSHGKTTTTAIIMHVFKSLGINFDYMVGSNIDNYESMVGLSDKSEIAVLEGDEYLTSALDRRPKFHLYKPDIAILNGIAWDHINVFPTFENYVEQFRIFIDCIEEGGTLIYYEGDDEVKKLALGSHKKIKKIPYKIHGFFQNKTGFYATTLKHVIPLKIFGEHNMQNLSAAKEACLEAGINEDDFYKAVQSFEGTAKRLQKLIENQNGVAYLDFAHSPSKVKATVEAVSARYPGKPIISCLELHTYSSLNINFLPHYSGTLDKTTYPYVYFNPHVLKVKNMPSVTANEVKAAFGNKKLSVFDNSLEMFSFIQKQNYRDPVFLFMSSGNFDGFNLRKLAEKLINT
ncbi:MAG TPA: Mur ligase family protein [Bacteroidales bacterium]|jgi:UDP-N-acetylmuramate: L-alanyl-gamma-D-glutamyl-meso-diaminopimelate ligase|nr:Mur ligase family protein [Bacteroidales bacterium]HQB36047.1 Mur ligase family protein [Bacteroidales bacterium]